MKRRLPWQFTMAAKLILSRLPIKYSTWKKVGLFKHGEMDSSEYAFSIVKKHFKNASSIRLHDNFSVLELGPGDSLNSALIAFSFGAKAVFLLDVDDFASKEIKPYIQMINFLAEQNYDVPKIDD